MNSYKYAFFFLTNYEMLVVLPKVIDGLPMLIKTLSKNLNVLKELLTSDRYAHREVILQLPKFHLGEKCIQLKEKFHKMGLKSISDP